MIVYITCQPYRAVLLGGVLTGRMDYQALFYLVKL
jgi:hypothetical protein